MKKFFRYLFVCSLILFCLTGCGKKDQQPETTEVAEKTTPVVTTVDAVPEKVEDKPAVVVAEPAVVVTPDDKATPEETTPVVEPTVAPVEVAPVVTPDVYDFTLYGNKIQASFLNGKVTVSYPDVISQKDVADALRYVGLILDVNFKDYSYNFTDGKLTVSYPKEIGEKILISNFQAGLNYYLPYFDYDKYDFDFYGLPIYVGLKAGNAVVVYPKNITKAEVSGLLDQMKASPEAVGFDYRILVDRVVSITYPSQIEESALLKGFVSELNKVFPAYMASMTAAPVAPVMVAPEAPVAPVAVATTPAVVEPVVKAPVKTGNSYEFTLMGAKVSATLSKGTATVCYPTYVSNDEIAKGLYYIGLILNVNSADFTYKFTTPGEVVVTYPANISDANLINGFKSGLNYYLAYYDYDAYHFEMSGYPVYVAIKDGDAIVAYPTVFKPAEIKGLLMAMLEDADMDGFSFNMIGNRVVEICYPKQLDEKTVINGFVSEFNKVLPKYMASMTATPVAPAVAAPVVAPVAVATTPVVVEPKVEKEVREEFVKNYKNFEFYLDDVHVDGMVSEKDVVFTYDSAFFDKNFEKGLVKIASTMTDYKTSDFTYKVSKGQLIVTYSEDIDPNEAIDDFFAAIFLL